MTREHLTEQPVAPVLKGRRFVTGRRWDWRTELLTAMSRRLPHPELPSARYLARVRAEPPRTPLTTALFGRVPRDVRVDDTAVPVSGGLRARFYRPTAQVERPPLVVAFHGGGFVMGNLVSTDWLCGQVASRVGATVVSIAYRMAPEHPAPVPFEDCLATTTWLMEHADELGVNADRTTVMGVSAGGNLAALVAIALRDRRRADHDVAALGLQVLLYPVVDLTLASPSVLEMPDGPILTGAVMDWYGRHYLPQGEPHSIASDDPRVSPLFAADHTDLAPALLVAAGRDPLRDDVSRYADVLRAAGVPAETTTYPNAIHGFVSMPRMQPDARPAVDRVVRAISAASTASR